MQRLIDADALKYEPLPKDERNYRTYNLDDAYEDGYNDAFVDVRNAPTIDAVPLSAVRKAAKKLAYIHQQIDLYGDRPDLHDEEYWLEYLMDEEWKDEEID